MSTVRRADHRSIAFSARRGVSPPEVLVVLLVVFFVAMVALFALPRQRENARLAGCRRNLMQVGVALALYDMKEGVLPRVPALGAPPSPNGGPLKAVLESLVLPDLNGLSDASNPPRPRPGEVPSERPLPGFVCPSAPRPSGPIAFPAPVSYRATAGDRPDGVNGGFAPGRTLKLAEIEDGDGTSFTAAFSERLLGTGRHDVFHPNDFGEVPGRPVGERGCPTGIKLSWRGDAGSSWAEASWRSTLYSHVIRPNERPSCVAADGKTARMGASSGHNEGVNVLIFDGSVRNVRSTIDPQVWKALATTHGVSPADGAETPRTPNGAPTR